MPFEETLQYRAQQLLITNPKDSLRDVRLDLPVRLSRLQPVFDGACHLVRLTSRVCSSCLADRAIGQPSEQIHDLLFAKWFRQSAGDAQAARLGDGRTHLDI